MKSHERFVTALNGGTPDRVPVFDFLFSPQLQKELLGHTTELYDGESQVKLAALLGLDAQFIPVNGYCGFEDEPHPWGSHYKDEWGVTYVKNGWPVMLQTDVPVKNREDWKNYRMPDPKSPLRVKMIRDAVKANDAADRHHRRLPRPFHHDVLVPHRPRHPLPAGLRRPRAHRRDERRLREVGAGVRAIAYERGRRGRLRAGRRLGRLHGPAHVPPAPAALLHQAVRARSSAACGSTACRS